MSYETRLKRLEEEISSTTTDPVRFLISFVDPDPAVGVLSALTMAAGMEQRSFQREAGESEGDLKRRARNALA